MKIAPAIVLATGLFATLGYSVAGHAADTNRPIVLTGNFQMQIPMDASGSTSDVLAALAQANQALGDLMGKQCALLSESFKRDCRVVQLNTGSSYSDNAARNFNRPGNYESLPTGNSNVNVTFQLTPHVDTK